MARYMSDDSGWPCYLSAYRHVYHLDLPVWEQWQDYETLARQVSMYLIQAQWWIGVDRQTSIHLDAQNRLHSENGPARTWSDGWALWYWHGTRVPRSLIAGEWTPTDILREPNAEIRRCAVERMGWDRYITEAGLTQVGSTVDDPGNPGQSLALYDVPEQIFEAPVRVLLCTNGTTERDGTRRRFGLTVPADIADPVAAAAWTYHDDDHPVRVDTATYAALQRRC